jgi:hypothetical protein
MLLPPADVKAAALTMINDFLRDAKRNDAISQSITRARLHGVRPCTLALELT